MGLGEKIRLNIDATGEARCKFLRGDSIVAFTFRWDAKVMEKILAEAEKHNYELMSQNQTDKIALGTTVGTDMTLIFRRKRDALGKELPDEVTLERQRILNLFCEKCRKTLVECPYLASDKETLLKRLEACQKKCKR